MARTAEFYIDAAQNAFEAGFASKAAQKRALDDLNRAYGMIKDALMDATIKARTPENDAENNADYWAIPFDLHNVRDRHFAIAAKYTPAFEIVRDMVELRNAIKAAPIAPAPVKSETEVKAAAIIRTVAEEIERRKATYINGLDMTRLINEMFPRADGKIALPVSVNAHLVHGHKGTVFVRHFFYLNGKLTPLNTIVAIADTLAREAAQ